MSRFRGHFRRREAPVRTTIIRMYTKFYKLEMLCSGFGDIILQIIYRVHASMR